MTSSRLGINIPACARYNGLTADNQSIYIVSMAHCFESFHFQKCVLSHELSSLEYNNLSRLKDN